MFSRVVLPALLIAVAATAPPVAHAVLPGPPSEGDIEALWMNMNGARSYGIVRGILRDATAQALTPILGEQLQQLARRRYYLPLADLSISDEEARAEARTRAIDATVRALATSIDTNRSILGREMFFLVPELRDTVLKALLERMTPKARTPTLVASVTHIVTIVMENSLQIELSSQIAFNVHNMDYGSLSPALRDGVIERILMRTYRTLAHHMVSVLGEVTLTIAFGLPFAPPSERRCKKILTPTSAP